MQKITPFLWFNGNLEEAINFYTSVFTHAEITRVSRYGDAGPGPKGKVMTARFRLEGQEFMGLNAGPEFSFTPAISFFVTCKTQEEVDGLWEKLTAGGKEMNCGWLTDKFGLCWQIIPSLLEELLYDKDPVRSARVMKAMMKMVKIESKLLQEAYDQE